MTSLTDVNGVSQGKEETLNEANIYTAECLAGSNAAYVDSLKNCSAELVASAIRTIGHGKQDMDHSMIHFECSVCGKNFKNTMNRTGRKLHVERCKEKQEQEAGSTGPLFGGG